jgi:hypothetical protein
MSVVLTEAEQAYLKSQPLARLATVDASGAPQNNPVGAFLDEETGDILIGGHAMGASRKFRNVRNNGQDALVVDDLVSRYRGGAGRRRSAGAVHEPRGHPHHARLDLELGCRPCGAGPDEPSRLTGERPAPGVS